MFAFAGPSAGDDVTDTCKPDTAPSGVADTACSDSDKALVIACVKQLVDGGKASWRRLPTGNIELCLDPASCLFLAKIISRD
jgi:hypothetical protein